MTNRSSKLPPDLQKQIDNARALGMLAPFLNLLSRAGMGGDKLKQFGTGFAELAREADELAGLPGRFSAAFAQSGWVFSESIGLDAVRSALQMAEGGDFEAGQEALCAAYEGDQLPLLAAILRQTPAFSDRFYQLQEAVSLTLQGRYLASIPLLLIIADGVGQDYFGKAIFSEGVDLTELGSLAGQPDGLPKLVADMCRTRRKLNTDEISFPYRNGILHGRDVNYGNRLVSAKCWALLINISDVIRAREASRAFEAPSEPTLGDAIKSLQETRARQRKIEEWTPRETFEGDVDALDCEISSFEAGTPEAALIEFLRAWSTNNFGQMGRATTYFDNRPVNKRAGEIREMMDGFRLTGARVRRVRDKAAAAAEISVDISYEAGDRTGTETFDFFLTSVDDSGEIKLPNEAGAHWEVAPRYQGWAMQQRFGRG